MAPPPCERRRAPVLLTSAPPELGRSGGVWCGVCGIKSGLWYAVCSFRCRPALERNIPLKSVLIISLLLEVVHGRRAPDPPKADTAGVHVHHKQTMINTSTQYS